MKLRFPNQSRRGGVLAMTLIIALLVGIVVGALLVVAQQQNYLTARSQTWCAEIPIAEAGVEEAMAHVNSVPRTLATNGWQKSPDGTKVFKHREIGDGYFYATITTATPPSIVSIGFGRIPLQTSYTHRTVLVLTTPGPPAWGIIAKKNITMDGRTAVVDSYNSSDPEYSGINGRYDFTKRRDRAGVASLSTNKLAIDTAGGRIYGSVATGPGGSVSGNVGDGAWLASNNGIQPGHFFDDFNMAIPDVHVPPELPAALEPNRPILPINGVTYTFDVRDGNYAVSGSSMRGAVLVSGKARLYVKGDLKMTGSGDKIIILPGASLEMFVDGNISMGGGGIVNGNNVPGMCVINGTTACTSVKFNGGPEMNAAIYVPNADLELSGSTEFSGKITANSISIKGTPAIHYDEALGAGDIAFRITRWQELAK